jgi:EAL domain-containing protein (putative c-di-GMP-specific phosphodiesterase class I)
MTQQFAASDPQLVAPEPFHGPFREPFYVRLGDALVIVSATLVSLAAGAWLISRLELDLSYAILAALGAYCTLLLLHLSMRRAVMGSDATEADAGNGDHDIHWQTGAEAFEAALSRHAAEGDDSTGPEEKPKPSVRLGAWAEPLPMPALGEAEASQAFKFRPARIPYFDTGEEAVPAPAKEPATEARETAGGALGTEINVEVIQELIKKLADELNGPPARDAETQDASEPDANADAMIGRSAAALDTAARAMRTGTAEARPALAPPVAARGTLPEGWPTARNGTEEGGPPPLDSQLARIAEAVAAERFEVLIEPIHALSEGRPRHYEVSMRLRTADGEQLEQPDYTRAAQSTELLPHIDAARMLRAVRVARRLAERGRQGSVLSAMAGDSITDNAFLDAAARETANDGRVRLVLSFAQSDARAFTPAHAEALGAMAGSGFAFALDDVTDLEMDFGRLKALGFEFVKLDAQVFLDGMQAPGGCIPAADICRYLSEFGLTLIIGAIEDDWLLAKVMGFGVLFGKGTLFGGPRLIKAMEPKTAAA